MKMNEKWKKMKNTSDCKQKITQSSTKLPLKGYPLHDFKQKIVWSFINENFVKLQKCQMGWRMLIVITNKQYYFINHFLT